MTVVAEYTVPADAFSAGRVLRVDPGYTMKLVEFVPVGDNVIPYLWVQNSEQGFASFEEQVRSDELVASLTALDGHSNRMLYRIEWAERIDNLMGAFRTFDIAVEEAVGMGDTWRFRVFYEDHSTLSEFRKYCAEHDIPLSIERIYQPSPPDENPAYGLTTDQQEAISIAFDKGYFEIPRETTMTELGEELDISRQAVSNRLRRGLTQLLAQTVNGHK